MASGIVLDAELLKARRIWTVSLPSSDSRIAFYRAIFLPSQTPVADLVWVFFFMSSNEFIRPLE
jgi:hypothetical protein